MPLRTSISLRMLSNIPHFSALKYRDYRFTWLANMCSGAAMWTFIVAISWLILEKSNSSSDVGIITFASMLPFLVVSPVAGMIADMKDRRSIAVVTFASNAVVTGAVVALALSDTIMLFHIAILTFLSGTMRSTQEPAIASLVPNQVPRAMMLNAITLNAATRHGARFVGLLVAAPLLATLTLDIDLGITSIMTNINLGAPGVLILSLAFQLLGTVFMALVRTRSTGEPVQRRNFVRSMVDGLVYIYANRMIAIFILLVAFHCALVMSFDSVFPVFSRDELGAEDGSVLGYLVMAFGAGSLVGAVLMAGVRSDRNKGRWLLWTGILSGVSPIMLAFASTSTVAVVVSLLMGGAQSTFMALTTTYVQTIAPDRLRGRISSLYILHAGGIMAFANLGYGFIADAFSSPPILYVSATLFLIFLFAAGIGLPDLRRVYGTGRAVAPAAA